MIEVKRVTIADDLQAIVDDINGASWDAANDVSTYDVESLTAYLQKQDTLFVVAHLAADAGRTFLGMASCRFELKPYDEELWLYVDEVDVAADQRRKGAGAAIMKALLEIADEADCDEVWLGTEVDNVAANALYKSLDPDDVAQVVGYTWELED